MLERRLAWDGLTLETIAPLLDDHAEVQTPSEEPGWIKLTRKVQATLSNGLPDLAQAVREDLTECPFAEILAVYGITGWQSFLEKGGASTVPFGQQVEHDIQVFLIKRLSPVAAPVLYQFLTFHQARFREEGKPGAYAAFIDDCAKGKLFEIFGMFPVLARTLAEMTVAAVDGLHEMFHRLEADRHTIVATLCGGNDPGEIDRVEPGLSDRHNGGRQVGAIVFASGQRIFYKPKPVGFDAAFQSVLASLGDHVPDPIPIVDCGTHGWAVEVLQGAFLDRDAVATYFRRSGGLLAVAYAFEGSDFIMDNIVASHSGAAAIDCEAALQPMCLPAASDGTGADELREKMLDRWDFTVLDTGFLPFWQTGGGGMPYDISGIGGGGGYVSRSSQPTWEAVNADGMRMVEKPVEVPPEKNSTLLTDRTRCDPSAFARDIEDGFTTTYRELVARKDDLLAASGVEETFAGKQGRYLFRATGVYGQMLQKLAAPECLASGVRRSLEAEVLFGPFVTRVPDRPLAWSMLCDERDALLEWDVPFFSSAASEASLPHQLVTPLAMVRDRIAKLDEGDLSRQRRLLRNILYLRPQAPFLQKGEKVPALQEDPAFWRQRFTREVAELANRLTNLPGGLTFSLGDFSGAQHFGGAPEAAIDADLAAQEALLYTGRSGYALFLAGAARVCGEAGFGEQSSQQLVLAFDELENAGVWNAEAFLHGGTNGLPSFVFASAVCASLAPETCREPLDRALEAFGSIPSEKVAEGTRADLTGGHAGTVLALLGALEILEGSLGGDEKWGELLKERAIASGERLLALAEQSSGGTGPLWDIEDGLGYFGYAHGATGVGAALARLGRVSGEERFLAMACQVLALVESHLPKDGGCWPVGFSGDGSVMKRMETWCHGTPGILLFLLAMADALPKERAEERKRVGVLLGPLLERLRAEPLHAIDDFCCGNAGRVEALLCAADGLEQQRPVLDTLAAGLQAQVLNRRNELGLFSLGSRKTDAYLLPPSLFKGLSGAGYTLARLADPSLPSPLAFTGRRGVVAGS